MKKTLTTLLCSFVLAIPAAQATSYEIDPTHSSVGFSIRHLVSNTRGSFRTFEGTFDYVPGKPELWKVSAKIDVASIDTAVPKRDDHLRSKDFFDVNNKEHPDYKTMTFVSTKASKNKLHGTLTMHGISKPVVLDLTIGGEGTDPWGNRRSGFTAATTLNRKDFGLTWNQALETGGLLVGEEVVVSLEMEGIVKEPTPAEASPKK